jgi:hypothetical protein
MIHGLYGLAHLGLSHFNALCKQEDINYAIATPQGIERREVGKDIDPYPVIVISAVNFLKIHKKFKSRRVCMFVIDNPLQLEALGAAILGCTKMRSYHYRFFPVKSQDLRMAIESCGDNLVEIKLKKTRVLYDMMRAAAAESILSPMQTAFYIMKNVEARTKVQDAVFDWLAGRLKENKLKSVLYKNTSEVVRTKMFGLLDSQPFLQLRIASMAVINDKIKFDIASKKFKVPLFDLKYVTKKAAAKLNIELPG